MSTQGEAPLCLLEKRADGVALITLNRPARLNAISPEMFVLVMDHIADCENDADVRCVALTGAGARGFTTGADIKGLQVGPNGANTRDSRIGDLDDRIDDLRRRQNGSVLKLHTMPKPTVAIVNGYAVGAGASLALSCDIRLFGDGAKLSTGFRNLAVSGDMGGPYFLSKLVGGGVARELLFTGEMLNAERCLELGIANRVYPHDRLLDQALEFCAALAAGPTKAFGRMKENLAVASSASIQDALDHEARNMWLSMLDADHYECVQAFIEKRPPRYVGH